MKTFERCPFHRLCSEYKEIQAWHLKNFSSDSSGQNSKYCKGTVKWRTANVFTVKQLTICPGWLLRKTILERFRWFGNFVLQEIGSRRALHQGWKWALNWDTQTEITLIDFDCLMSIIINHVYIVWYACVRTLYQRAMGDSWQAMVDLNE